MTLSNGVVRSTDQEFEEVLHMLDKARYESDARELSAHVVTQWDGYDFSEKSEDLEKRVPRIEFAGITDVDWKARKPEHVEGVGYEKYIRRYEITYRDKHYVFVITVDSHWGCVRKFSLTAYGVTEEESSKLFVERL